ncbi:hypothetical protein WIW50_02720 [Flavobacteriaceae bacterium 3-367]
MKKTIWISYDFGLKGDHEGLYRWLDENNAEERGYGMALIKNFNFPKKYISDRRTDEIFTSVIKKQIKDYTKIEKGDRIYMIWKGIDDSKLKGKFLFGNKKNAPWTGYSQGDNDFIDTEVDG